jgi:hypothetical protein
MLSIWLLLEVEVAQGVAAARAVIEQQQGLL